MKQKVNKQNVGKNERIWKLSFDPNEVHLGQEVEEDGGEKMVVNWPHKVYDL